MDHYLKNCYEDKIKTTQLKLIQLQETNEFSEFTFG